MATSGEAVGARRRAPRREGKRTTLRLPEPLATAAEEAARELGTTENDAVVLFALKGAALYRQQRDDERRGHERWTAVLDSGTMSADYPTLDEMEQAAGTLRRELAEK